MPPGKQRFLQAFKTERIQFDATSIISVFSHQPTWQVTSANKRQDNSEIHMYDKKRASRREKAISQNSRFCVNET